MIGSPTVAALDRSSAPTEIIERARTYIASQVGHAYATQNYEIQPQSCLVTSRRDKFPITTDCNQLTPADDGTIEAYIISFTYRPWADIQASDPAIRVRVPLNPALPASGYVATFDKVGRIIEPTVKRAEAEAGMSATVKEAALQLPIHFLVPGSSRHANPVWSGSFTIGEPTPSSWVTRRVTVDAVNGHVVVEPDVTSVGCD